MGANQTAEIAVSLNKVYEGLSSSDEPTAYCTIEANTSSDAQVWIQALPGNVNMVYPLTEEPLELLSRRGVRSPPDTYLVEWAPGEYATFGFNDLTPRDHASFIDQLFVKILGCDDETYSLKTTIESL